MTETRTPPPRVVLEWDLTRSHRASDVGWPDLFRDHRFWQGDLQLTLKLPARVLVFELADARAERRGEDVSVIQLRGHPQTLEDAVAEVERRMRELDLPRRDLDQWIEDVRSGDFQRVRVFATRRNDLRPSLSLEVKRSYEDERPWYVSWEIAWLDLAPPPARP
jgi:hypothetical protein